jgi:hypothetical protein
VLVLERELYTCVYGGGYSHFVGEIKRDVLPSFDVALHLHATPSSWSEYVFRTGTGLRPLGSRIAIGVVL